MQRNSKKKHLPNFTGNPTNNGCGYHQAYRNQLWLISVAAAILVFMIMNNI